MFKGASVVRIIPDNPSKGGSKTAQSTFISNQDIRVARNIWVYQGRWQKTPALEAYGPIATPAQLIVRSFSIHNYLKYSLTNAALGPSSIILTHDKGSDGTNYINGLFTDPIARASPPIRSVLASPDECTPAVFANIKNRCFISWSGTNSFIFDGTGTTYNGEYSYDIGVDGPVTAPTYLLTGDNIATGDVTPPPAVSVTHGSPYVTSYDTPFQFSGWGTGTQSIKVNGTNYDILSPDGYENTFTVGGSCTNLAGSPNVTIVGFLFPPNDKWNGLALNMASPTEQAFIKSYTLVGADTHVVCYANVTNAHTTDTYTVDGQLLTMTSPYQGGTEIVTATVTTYDGVLSWSGAGPQYAYAYYDPVTGHVSNASPFLQIAEQNMKGVNVSVRDIMPSVTTDQTRFTKIIVFRTVTAGGGVLLPIGVFGLPPTFDTINNTGAIALSYPDLHPDSDLLQNSLLAAPQNNQKPPASTHMMFYDQRVWLSPVEDPTAVIFSAAFNEVPFGVAEESFRPENLLRIPSDDGRVRGLRCVGSTGQIMTDRFSYVIVGGGVDSASYRLVRLGPQTFGVGDYQMDELPGDIGDNSAALVYLSRDAREFILAPSYGNVPLTDPVSDTFSEEILTPDAYYDSRIHYYPATNVRLLVTSLPDLCMVYNFDQKTWCEADATFGTGGNVRPQGFATIYGGANPVDLFTVNAGIVYRWMNVNATPGPDTAYLETAPISFSGAMKRRQRVAFVRIYTDSPTCNVTITVDETSTPFVIAAIAEPDPRYSLYAPTSVPVDNPNARELVAFNLSAVTGGTTIASDGFRHTFRVTLPGDLLRYSIYAIDLGYQILDVDGDLTP